MSKNRLPLVGAFVVGGLLLFAVGLFLIGDRRMLFTDTFELYAEFSRVSGLENGGKVRVAGMDAGEVEEIHVPTGPTGKFRLKLRVREDLHPLIRVDSVASIQNDGLVGNKFVQVEAGSEGSPEVPPKGTIQSREPFDLADMLNKMNEAIDLITATITEVKGGVDEAVSSITDTADGAQVLIADVGKDVRAITESSRKATDNLTAIVAGVRQGRGSVGKLLNDDALYVSARNIVSQAEKAVANLREASEQAKGAVADFRGDSGPMKGLAGNLQQTLTSAREAMSDLAENTEALKRSFFFRGFFNRRGYFDLSDVSVQQYREGALASGDRRPLRIWAGAPVLFAKDADGQEQLTDDGRLRLDAAMAAFVKYPKTSPFVIEGYAEADTGDVRFLSSRRRAELLRDYVVGKYGLDPDFVAIMSMGAEADDSPTGKRWDGVALTMFVPRSVS